MKLVQIDSDTFINIEKVCGLKSLGPDCTYIFFVGSNKIEVRASLYKVKTAIENAMREE
jgi:hypothetical protein